MLTSYFLTLLPPVRIFLRGFPWLLANADTVFFASVVLILLATHKTDLTGLGFSTQYLKQHLTLGLLGAVPLLLALPLLNLLGAGPIENLLGGGPAENLSRLLATALLVPLIEQVFFTGFVVQSLLRKYNPVLVIYGAGLIYMLAGFQLTLASFALGLITAGLFKFTGTLYASIVFHMGCALAGVLLVAVYPQLITVLGFLF